jgi:NAD(P)-dependent dehydrogenase (short-subunit alcohol dehydrogenase family)
MPAGGMRVHHGLLGEPEDLSGLAILLASDASGYVTSQDSYVDGGWLAKMSLSGLDYHT